jgi:hypothetical protein
MKLHPIFAAVLLASSSVAVAQTDGKQQPPTTAPAESSHAPGHDAQTGKPETGEKEKNDLSKKQGTDKKPPQDQGTRMPNAPK